MRHQGLSVLLERKSRLPGSPEPDSVDQSPRRRLRGAKPVAVFSLLPPAQGGTSQTAEDMHHPPDRKTPIPKCRVVSPRHNGQTPVPCRPALPEWVRSESRELSCPQNRCMARWPGRLGRSGAPAVRKASQAPTGNSYPKGGHHCRRDTQTSPGGSPGTGRLPRRPEPLVKYSSGSAGSILLSPGAFSVQTH